MGNSLGKPSEIIPLFVNQAVGAGGRLNYCYLMGLLKAVEP